MITASEAAAIAAKRRADFIDSDRGKSAIAIIEALVKSWAEAGGYLGAINCDVHLSSLYIAKPEAGIIAAYLRSLGYDVVASDCYLSIKWDG